MSPILSLKSSAHPTPTSSSSAQSVAEVKPQRTSRKRPLIAPDVENKNTVDLDSQSTGGIRGNVLAALKVRGLSNRACLRRSLQSTDLLLPFRSPQRVLLECASTSNAASSSSSDHNAAAVLHACTALEEALFAAHGGGAYRQEALALVQGDAHSSCRKPFFPSPVTGMHYDRHSYFFNVQFQTCASTRNSLPVCFVGPTRRC